ncbi:MAG: hypothetical protein AB7I50_26355 [Vicinamibacterales bacterium]
MAMLAPFAWEALWLLGRCESECNANSGVLAAMAITGAILTLAVHTREPRWLVPEIRELSLVNLSTAQERFVEIPATAQSRAESLAVFDADDTMRDFDPQYRAQIWFDIHESNRRILHALTSMRLWEYSLLSIGYPELRDSPSSEMRKLRVGDGAIILGSRPEDFSKAQTNLNAIGLEAIRVDSRHIQRGHIVFDVTYVRLVPCETCKS